MTLSLRSDTPLGRENNIIVEKYWADDCPDLFDVKITCFNKYVTVWQTVMVVDWQIEDFSRGVLDIVSGKKSHCYFELGADPDGIGFFMEAFMGSTGQVLIEVNIGINDTSDQDHRCKLFVDTEIGLFESFGNNFMRLLDGKVGEYVMLNP